MCMCACVHACVCACMHACACMCARGHLFVYFLFLCPLGLQSPAVDVTILSEGGTPVSHSGQFRHSKVLKLSHFVLCKINPRPLCVVFHSLASLSPLPWALVAHPPLLSSLSFPPASDQEEADRLGECCFQSGHVTSTPAQFALRSVSWSRAVGSPPP